jgi:predicted nucleic acid-binding protein
MLVVDTSAIVEVIAARTPSAALVERIAVDGDLHAPHLIDVEVLHVLRRLTRTGTLSEDRAADVRLDFTDLAILRYPHEHLADRAWELRHGVTAYDAVFVALAEALEAPLVTCDRALAGAPGARAEIELFEPAARR